MGRLAPPQNVMEMKSNSTTMEVPVRSNSISGRKSTVGPLGPLEENHEAEREPDHVE